MIKKITFYILCGMILLFSFSCYENDQEATITVDFGSVEALQEATGISEISKASSIIPYTVSTIEIKVYSGDEVKGVVYRKIFYRRDFGSDKVTINVPAGSGRIVKAIARHMDGTTLYTGTSAALNLVSGVDVTVPVEMRYYPNIGGPAYDAQFTLNIQDPDGTSYTAPGFVGSIVVRIYRPAVSYSLTSPEGYLELGSRDTDGSYAASTTTVSGLWAYPYTYQMIIVMAMAPDNTIAAIGGTVISTLKSGTNTTPVVVTMIPPASVWITNGAANINTIVARMNFGAGYVTVNPSNYSTYFYGTSALVYLPNRVNNIREWEDPALHGVSYINISRDVQLVINGTTYSFIVNDSSCLRWKTTYAAFNGSYWEWYTDFDSITGLPLIHTH